MRVKNIELTIAMVNTETNEEIQQAELIQEWPVAKLFVGGYLYTMFMEPLTSKNIIEFCDSILTSKRQPIEVNSDRSYVRFNNLSYAIAMTFPKVTDSERVFARNLQTLYPTIPVFFTSDDSNFSKLLFPDKSDSNHFRFLFKRDFDDGDKISSGTSLFEANDIIGFITRLRHPRVQQISKKTIDDVIAGQYKVLILFDNDFASERVDLLSKALLTKKFEGITLKANGKEDSTEVLMSYLGVRVSDFPCMRIIQFQEGKVLKYRFDGEWTRQSIEIFLESHANHEIVPYIKNDSPISNKGEKVLRLNREQYYKMRNKGEVAFVVAFVAGACQKCDEIRPLLENTRRLVKDQKMTVFATVEMDFNDIDEVDIAKVPIIEIIVNGSAREYTGEKKEEVLAASLNAIISDEL
jgi:thiol-disulfide isomerase/thioredoxin